MDTTQYPMPGPEETTEAALVALDEADPADAPEAAELVADALTTALDHNEVPVEQASEGTKEGAS